MPTSLTANFGGATGTNSFGFRAHRTANQINIATGVETKVQLNVEGYDPQGDFDAVTNFRYTPSKAGKYLFTGLVQFGDIADGAVAQSIIKLNGSTPISQVGDYSASASNDPWALSSTIFDMNGTTDFVELFCFHQHGSNRNITGSQEACYLTGQLIGD